MLSPEKSMVIIAMLILYALFMVFITWRGRNKAKTTADFMTAGKSGKLYMIASSYLGDHVGTGIVIGGATYGVTYGLGGGWYGLGAALSFVLFGLLVAGWAYDHKYLTIPTYLRERYPKTGRIMTVIWALLGSAVGVTTLCGQIMAGRQLFTYLGIDPLLGSILSVIVILLYCTVTGMWGAITLGFWQAVIIIVGLIIAMFYCFSGGGWTTVVETLPADHFDWVPFDGATLFAMCVPTAIYGLTSGACMQLTASSNSKKSAVGGALVGAVLVAVVTFFPVLLGMYGAAVFPEADSASIIFTVIMESMPTWIAGLMLAAIIAAVMSTCDTTVMTVVTSLVYDAYGNVVAPELHHTPKDKNMRNACSVILILLFVFALILSFTSNDIISVLSSGYTIWVAGGMIPFMAGRLWKGTTSYGALASMIVGSLFAWADLLGITNFPSSLVCLIPAAITVVVVSLLTKDKAASKAE